MYRQTHIKKVPLVENQDWPLWPWGTYIGSCGFYWEKGGKTQRGLEETFTTQLSYCMGNEKRQKNNSGQHRQ